MVLPNCSQCTIVVLFFSLKLYSAELCIDSTKCKSTVSEVLGLATAVVLLVRIFRQAVV